MKMNIGNQEIIATYDEWEELFEKLEKIFGVDAVEDNSNPEKLDSIDVEIYYNSRINQN